MRTENTGSGPTGRPAVMPCTIWPAAVSSAIRPSSARSGRSRPAIRLAEPTKSATNAVARAIVDLLGRADLLDLAVVHDDDPVGHRQRLLLVVRDVERGDAEPVLQFAQLDPHLGAQLGVEVRERLVEQQHRSARRRWRAPARRAAAGRPTVSMPGARRMAASARGRARARPSPRSRLPAACAPATRRRRCRTPSCAARSRRTGTPSTAPRFSAGTLTRSARRNRPSCRRSRIAPRARRLQPGDRAQRGGLAAARGAEQRQLLARRDGEADAVRRPARRHSGFQILDLDIGRRSGLQRS